MSEDQAPPPLPYEVPIDMVRRLHVFAVKTIYEKKDEEIEIAVRAKEIELITERIMETEGELLRFRLDYQTIEKYQGAISDLNCWLGGFIAAGGTYSPGTEYVLRDLKDWFHRMNG